MENQEQINKVSSPALNQTENLDAPVVEKEKEYTPFINTNFEAYKKLYPKKYGNMTKDQFVVAMDRQAKNEKTKDPTNNDYSAVYASNDENSPTANIPQVYLKKAVTQAVKPVNPTKEEILENKSPVVINMGGGKSFEVTEDMINAINTGNDINAMIEKKIDETLAIAETYQSTIPKFEDTSKLPVDGTFQHLTMRDQRQLENYQLNRQNLFEKIKDDIKDPKLIELLISDYSTGEFYREVGRQLMEFPRFVGNIPNGLQIMGKHIYPILKGALTNTTIAEELEKIQPSLAKEMADHHANYLYGFAPFKSTYARALNEKLKEKYIKIHGIEAYNDRYAPLIGKDKRVDIPMISEELGNKLLDIGFKELPIEQQFVAFLVANGLFTAPFAKLNAVKGIKHLKMVDLARKTDKSLELTDDVTAYRILKQRKLDKLSKFRFDKYTGDWLLKMSERFNIQGAVGNASVTRQVQNTKERLTKEINELENKLSTGRRSKKLNYEDEMDILRKLGTLRTQRNKIYFQFGGNPFYFATAVDEGIIAIGQTIGYNYISDALEVEPATGGMLGALSFAMLGKSAVQYGVNIGVKLPLAFADAAIGTFRDDKKLVTKIFTTGLEAVDNLASIFTFGATRGMLANREFEEIDNYLMRKRGSKLTKDERESMIAMDSLIKNLPEEQRAAVFEALNNYHNTRSRILNLFEGEEREEMEDLLRVSFAAVTGLAPLQAIEVSGLSQGMSGKTLQEGINIQKVQEAHLEYTEKVIDRIRLKVKNSTGVDTKNKSYLENYFNNMYEVVNTNKIRVQQNKNAYKEAVDEYERYVLSQVDGDMDPNFIRNITAMKIDLDPNAGANLKKRIEILQESKINFLNAVNKKHDELNKIKGSSEHRARLNTLTENIYEEHESAKYEIKRLIYANAAKDIGDVKINLVPFIKNLVGRKDKILDEGGLRAFFSKEGEFFKHFSTRNAFKAFEDMAIKGFRNNGFDLDELRTLKARFSTKIIKEGGVDKANAEYISDNPTYLEIALKLYADSKGKGFNPFQAGVFEAEEFRRALQYSGKRFEKSDLSRAQKFTEAAGDLENILNGGDAGQILKLAKNEYKKVSFDPVRPGSIGEKIDKAITGPAYSDGKGNKVSIGGLKFPYRRNLQPIDWHKDIAENLERAIAGGRNAERDLKRSVIETALYWADDIVFDPIENTYVPVFNTYTPLGRAKALLVKNTVESNFKEHWGVLRQEILTKNTTGNRVGGDMSDFKVGEYDFKRLKKMEEINQSSVFTLKEITEEGGKPVDAKLLDLEEFYALETDIIELTKKSPKLQKAHKNFKDYVVRVGKSSETLAEVNILNRVEQVIEEATKIRNPQAFVQDFVIDGSAKKIEILKDGVIQALMNPRTVRGIQGKTQRALTAGEAEEAFKDHMSYLLFNGLIDTGDYAPAKVATLKGLSEEGGQDLTKLVLGSPEKIINLIEEGTETRKIFEEIFDEDVLDDILELSNLVMTNRGVARMSFTPEGRVRPISYNEIISRAFNIARGMVSVKYVAAEYAFRLLQTNKISVLTLAAKDTEMSKFMIKLLRDKKSITAGEIENFSTKLLGFVSREWALSNRGIDQFIPPIVSEDDIINANLQEESD